MRRLKIARGVFLKKSYYSTVKNRDRSGLMRGNGNDSDDLLCMECAYEKKKKKQVTPTALTLNSK